MSAFANIFKKRDDERSRIIKDFFTTGDNDINLKTDLNDAEIELLSKMELQHNLIKKKFGATTPYEQATRLYKELKVSHKRKGRKEWVTVTKQDSDQKDENKIKKMLGL